MRCPSSSRRSSTLGWPSTSSTQNRLRGGQLAPAERELERLAQGGRARRVDERGEAELRGLLGAPVLVGDGAQLAGQADLAEAGQRLAVVAGGDAAGRAGHGERDRQVGPRLVD